MPTWERLRRPDRRRPSRYTRPGDLRRPREDPPINRVEAPVVQEELDDTPILVPVDDATGLALDIGSDSSASASMNGPVAGLAATSWRAGCIKMDFATSRVRSRVICEQQGWPQTAGSYHPFLHLGSIGQHRTLNSSVLLIGIGGLGSPAGLHLAAAGVSILGFAEFDVVDLSNLYRQVLHHAVGLRRPKTESAAFGVVPGMIGCVHVNTALALFLGFGETPVGRLLILNALNMEFTEV